LSNDHFQREFDQSIGDTLAKELAEIIVHPGRNREVFTVDGANAGIQSAPADQDFVSSPLVAGGWAGLFDVSIQPNILNAINPKPPRFKNQGIRTHLFNREFHAHSLAEKPTVVKRWQQRQPSHECADCWYSGEHVKNYACWNCQAVE